MYNSGRICIISSYVPQSDTNSLRYSSAMIGIICHELPKFMSGFKTEFCAVHNRAFDYLWSATTWRNDSFSESDRKEIWFFENSNSVCMTLALRPNAIYFARHDWASISLNPNQYGSTFEVTLLTSTSQTIYSMKFTHCRNLRMPNSTIPVDDCNSNLPPWKTCAHYLITWYLGVPQAHLSARARR